jgi:hypothetical protein
MRISKPVKILIGLLTGWIFIYPFLFFFIWLFFVFGIAAASNSTNTGYQIVPIVALSIFFIIGCSAFIQIGLQLFYFIHIILNKSGNDVVRVVFAIGMFLLLYITMPIYYFVYILPDNPPVWALTPSTIQQNAQGTPID